MRQFFKNGYGVSVISDEYSYGGKQGLSELAVLTHEKDNKGNPIKVELCYNTPITKDVIGYLSEKEVSELIEQVKSLPSIV